MTHRSMRHQTSRSDCRRCAQAAPAAAVVASAIMSDVVGAAAAIVRIMIRPTDHIDAKTAPESACRARVLLMPRKRGSPPGNVDVLQRILVAVAAVDGPFVGRRCCGRSRCGRRETLTVTATDQAAARRTVAAGERHSGANDTTISIGNGALLMLMVLVQFGRLQAAGTAGATTDSVVGYLVRFAGQIQTGIVTTGLQRCDGCVEV